MPCRDEITLTPAMHARLKRLAALRGKDIESVLAEAIGLEEEYADAARSGGKLMVVRAGRLEELIPPGA